MCMSACAAGSSPYGAIPLNATHNALGTGVFGPHARHDHQFGDYKTRSFMILAANCTMKVGLDIWEHRRLTHDSGNAGRFCTLLDGGFSTAPAWDSW
jgi:hypothetical protein